DGLAVTKILKESPRTKLIPILLITASTRGDKSGDVARGLDMGAEDYMTKPVDKVEILARVRSLLRTKRLQDDLLVKTKQLEEINDRLELMAEERAIEIMLTRDAAIFGMAKLAESRDPETGAHLERIRNYTRTLAAELGANPKYSNVIDDEFVLMIYQSSPLHDIGKVGITDSVLLKPGRLEPDEFELMKQHAQIGGDALAATQRWDMTEQNFLSMGREIAYYHHERWDGNGYPKGLKGEQIPLAARIMALADVYDALASKRVYKEPMSHEEASRIIQNESGKQFDPDIVDAFLKVEQKFREIHQAHLEEVE
ncbi:MAG: HD domain-containing protein, partial [Nitrospinae bacterium]|nr:HD domain-containing protein [Nitrospinota bacterium]